MPIAMTVLVQQSGTSQAPQDSPLWQIINLLIFVGYTAGSWGVFAKAGRHGWAALIPIYNVLTLIWVARRSWWWLLLLVIPLVNIYGWGVVCNDVAKAFDRG